MTPSPVYARRLKHAPHAVKDKHIIAPCTPPSAPAPRTTGGQQISSRAERNAQHRARMACKHAHALSGLHIPYSHGAVGAAGGHVVAIGVPADALCGKRRAGTQSSVKYDIGGCDAVTADYLTPLAIIMRESTRHHGVCVVMSNTTTSWSTTTGTSTSSRDHCVHVPLHHRRDRPRA